jgi:cytochrome c biogenesis protein CcmG/thiol:disulfide interchange protein DsbE
MMNARRVINIVFLAILAYALYLKAPSILTHFKFQDQKAPNFSLTTMKGEKFTLGAQSKKVVLVFWATWCGPCEVELKRINEMIMKRKILPSDILAISIAESETVVRENITKNNYLFNIAIDKTGSISELYKVKATPTIIFIDQNQVINWMTAGMSPTLEFRTSSFLKP